MKDELQAEYDDWQQIFEAYKRSYKEGLELENGKEERCGLCPKYRVKVGEYLQCRKCPIVVLSGRTCDHWCRKSGLKQDNKLSIAHLAKEFLKSLIEMVE